MKILNFPVTVWLLAFISALAMTSGTMMVLVSGIYGSQVAPVDKLATLPMAVMIIGTASAVSGIALLMQKMGRRRVFLGAASLGVLASLLAAFAVSMQSFWGFCLAAGLLGISIAGYQQIRFAAIESADIKLAPKVVSVVLVGGLLAAILGPELSTLGQLLTPNSFQGTFYLLAIIQVICFALFTLYKPGNGMHKESEQHQQAGRTGLQLLTSAPFVMAVASASFGYALMAFIMTATPVHMHVFEHHSLADTKVVIQSHILAMFVPSFFSGWLIVKFGELKLILAGILVFLSCILLGFIASDYLHYWVALVLLGIAWNFLFTSGTSLLPKAYHQHERFRAQAMNDGIMFASQAIASLSAGAVLYFLGWKTMMLACIPMLALLFAILIWWQKSKVPENGESIPVNQ